MDDAPSGIMIESEIQGPESGERSMIVYWHTERCTDHPPYRNIVRWMRKVWSARFEVQLVEEPPEQTNEDFIEHHFTLDGQPVRVYWEDSLGYVSIHSDHESLIRSAAATLKDLKPIL